MDILSFLMGRITADGSGGGGGSEPVLIDKTISANGEYNASDDNADGYKKVTAQVPNSYSAGDEGKVVSSGALVSQTAHADVTPTTSDQTIDTTLNNSIKVIGDADLVAGNIKKDVQIFGVTGTYEAGGGAESSNICYANSNITLYSEKMIIDSSVGSSMFKKLKGATNLKSVLNQRTDAYGTTYNINNALQNCTSLEDVTLLNGVDTGGYCEDIIAGCPNIKTFTLGGIGHPNTVGVGPTSGSYLLFRSITVPFDIIIYANAASLADVPTILKTGSPWGAVNATVIYKSSVTGEVLT